MPRFLLKLPHPIRPYLEWSTISDAPITSGMSLDGLHEYVRHEYGREGLRGLDDRVRTADARDPRELVAFNRAGSGETCLTMEQVVAFWCEQSGPAELPLGHTHRADSGSCRLCWPVGT
jgi:hypothetical protein